MVEGTHWWRRGRPARTAWWTVWIAAVLACSLPPAITIASPASLSRAESDVMQCLSLIAIGLVIIASIVELMTCRARDANVDFALVRVAGAPTLGIGAGFIVGGALSASGVFDGGILDEDGSAFVVIGAVLSAAGALMFITPDLHRSQERRKQN